MKRALPLLFLFSMMAAGYSGAADLPSWIWIREKPAVFEKEFDLAGEIESARLKVTADFAAVEIWVNGAELAGLEPYDPPAEWDIRSLLKAGKNRITLKAKAVAGPPALAASLDVLNREGKTLALRSDATWGKPADVLGPVEPERWAANALPEISPFSEYNQWKEAQAGAEEKLSPLPPGFAIECLRRAGPEEGSWVSLAIDPQGRLLIGREDQGILRLTLPSTTPPPQPSTTPTQVTVEKVNDSLHECRGLAVLADGRILANANVDKALHRLEEGRNPLLLKATAGGNGHGRNDVTQGPAGRIHLIHGDDILVPDDAERIPAAMRSAPRDLGHWASTTVDGEGWRIHCRGLRNPYGIDFNPDGEAFTYDADNEGDVGLPFYRPTRINHLVDGANYGWHQDRENTRSLMVYAPDAWPATFDVGRGSPTGVKFGTRSQFPERYRRALFALDWAYGRIVAIHLTPRGASYYGSGEVFLEGRPLNVTDLDFTPDGAMVFVTGGRKTQSALYRVRYTGPPGPGEAAEPHRQARAQFSAEARQRRRQLENLFQKTGEAPPEVWPALGDPDPWIRNAARVVLEKRPVESWRNQALASGPDLAGLTALLALVRADASSLEAATARVGGFSAKTWGRAEKLTAMRIYEIASAGLSLEKFAPIRAQLEPFLGSTSDPVRREAMRILVLAASPAAVPAGLRLAADAGDQLERLHYLEMLGEARAGWSPDTQAAYFRALALARQLSRGDRFMAGFFKAIETSILARLNDEKDRSSFRSIVEAGEPENPDATISRPFVQNWTLVDFPRETAPARPNLERGAKLFGEALCGSCHARGALGRPVGPDLTRVGSRFSRRDLLESILEPSKVVSEAHRLAVITKKDGTTVTGRIVQDDFRNSKLYLSLNPFSPSVLTEVNKADIQSSEESSVSPMPPGLLNTLTREEIGDLLGWLEQSP